MPRKDNTNDTHSSYSPQDRPLQAPTRSRVNDHSEHQIGDVNIDDTLGGGYATFENCEENEGQGKGKLPLPKGRKDWRPSITEQRKSSLVSRVETAGKDAFRRSSTYLPSEKSVIDALADTFNTWSPGVDRPKAAVESERRVSWSERAMSFLFNREKPSLKQSAAGYQPAEDGGQHDVEYLASDGAYDDLQGTFYVWKDRPDTVTTNSAATKSQSLSSYADIVKQGLKRTNNNNGGTKADTGDQQKEWFDPDPEKARVAVPPRSVPKGNDQELWFDSDPESGRVALPPLSVNASKEQKNDKQQSSKLLHSLKGQKASTQAQDSLNEDQDFNIREKKLDWRTKATENYEDTQKTNKYDSDLENWKTHPSGVSHHSPTGDNQRWPEDYQLRDENH